MSVLIVDDEAMLRRILQLSLQRDRRFVADVASGGREAIQMLQSNHYNLVISDVRMAEVSGLELFRWIQRHQPQLASRFLFITGDVGNISLVDIETPVLHKPLRIGELTSRCAEMVAQAA